MKTEHAPRLRMIDLETLETRDANALDFLDPALRSIRDALDAYYQARTQDGRTPPGAMTGNNGLGLNDTKGTP